MKYRVNLFPEELKPRLELFTAGFVLLMWLLSGVVLFAVSESYQQEFKETKAATRDIQEKYNEQTKMLKMYTNARDTRAQDPELVSAVQKLQNEVRDKSLLLEELQGREQLKNQGFSMLMEDLSLNHVDGVWLTRININEQRVRMEGATIESSKVPFWVSRLRESDYFAGRSFAGARMFRDDEDNLNFVISSELSRAEAVEKAAGGAGQP